VSSKEAQNLMIIVRDSYKKRSIEVERYFEFLTAQVDSKADLLAVHDKEGDGRDVIVEGFVLSRELIKTLRANGYLLLYNLVESTMTNAINAIHQVFIEHKLSFNDLEISLRRIILKNFKKANLNDGLDHSKANPIQMAIMQIGYDKANLFSGNVDAKVIKKTAKDYGFKIADHDWELTKDGKRLLDIKNKRNDLAHGEISFEECGEGIAHEELVLISKETIAYLGVVLDGVDEYIKNQKYMAKPTIFDSVS
jgi:MAE_28990/MAE_18760-like HEPN